MLSKYCGCLEGPQGRERKLIVKRVPILFSRDAGLTEVFRTIHETGTRHSRIFLTTNDGDWKQTSRSIVYLYI